MGLVAWRRSVQAWVTSFFDRAFENSVIAATSEQPQHDHDRHGMVTVFFQRPPRHLNPVRLDEIWQGVADKLTARSSERVTIVGQRAIGTDTWVKAAEELAQRMYGRQATAFTCGDEPFASAEAMLDWITTAGIEGPALFVAPEFVFVRLLSQSRLGVRVSGPDIPGHEFPVTPMRFKLGFDSDFGDDRITLDMPEGPW